MTADELKQWRERLHLSQAAAADLIGCSRRAYQNYEAGKSAIPKSIALAVSAVLFNLPPYGTNP